MLTGRRAGWESWTHCNIKVRDLTLDSSQVLNANLEIAKRQVLGCNVVCNSIFGLTFVLFL